jgi:tRNA(Ser,Leu) C12 N-acetylase TAN1
MSLNNIINTNAKFLLVGCETAKERDAMSELWHVLIKYCQVKPIDIFELPIRGLFVVALSNDLNSVLEKLNQVISNKTFVFNLCKKFTPVEKIIPSTLENLLMILPSFLDRIPPKITWRIAFQRRHSKLKRQNVIEAIASHPLAPKGKVDLENPDWDIIIEIFGEWLGISVYPSSPVVTIIES